jgi:hypothetical protein
MGTFLDIVGVWDMKIGTRGFSRVFSRGMVDAGGGIKCPYRLVWRERG